MNTTESLELVFALAEGALLGVFFFRWPLVDRS